MDGIRSAEHSIVNEREPLLPPTPDEGTHRKKRFYRPRPLWLVPFAVTAALVRGMTLAPRVQVFTQLSCASIYQDSNVSVPPAPTTHFTPFIHAYHAPSQSLEDPVVDDDYILLPSAANMPEHAVVARPAPDRCQSDPAVQSRAARLQTTFMIVMGITSALTTGWWGHFGEKYGRMRVLAFGTLGLMLSDITFIVVSDPNSSLPPQYGHLLLTLAPLFEGLMGGWSSLQGATSAYLSDCTSDGKSRARVFSRFNGVFYLGFAAGPTIGAWLVRHPIFHPGSSALRSAPTKDITSVFYVAALSSFINLFLVLFVFPESLHSKSGLPPPPSTDAASVAETKKSKAIWVDFVEGFSHVLSVFAPSVQHFSGGRKRKNWSMTLLACVLSLYFLSSGIFQIKYLYAGHIFGWESEELSYYIFLAGGLRAINLLFVMPFIISMLKSKPQEPTVAVSDTSAITSTSTPHQPSAQHVREMQFDLQLTRASFAIDILSHILVSLAPATASSSSQWMFVWFSVLSSFGSGVIPTVQSLSLNIFKASGSDAVQGRAGAGKLFGAIAALQAVFQMILGPTLFAVVYSTTVAVHPKAIFNCAAGILIVALFLVSFVRTPKGVKPKKQGERNFEHVERGRSRRTKDLRVEVGVSPGSSASVSR